MTRLRSPLRRGSLAAALLGWGTSLTAAFLYDRATPTPFGSDRFWGTTHSRNIDRDFLQVALALVAVGVVLAVVAALLDLAAKGQDRQPFSTNISVLLLMSLSGLVWLAMVSASA